METVIFICPTCKGRYHTYKDSMKCRDSHFPFMEKWLMCKCGYGVRCSGYVMKNCIDEFERHKKEHCSIVGGNP